MIEKIKDWMVWAERYILWGMFIALVIGLIVSPFYFAWQGVNDYRLFNSIIHGENVEESDELEIEMLGLTFTQIGADAEDFRYVSVRNLAYHFTPSEKAALLQQADTDGPIAGVSSSPSFLIDEQHIGFWRTNFIIRLVLYYGSWIFFLLFMAVYGYLNIRQNNKLLTKEVERLLGGTFLLFTIGWFGHDMLNQRTITFLKNEFSLNESTGALQSYEMYFLLLALLLAYSLIAKAVPVQEEQDLTV